MLTILALLALGVPSVELWRNAEFVRAMHGPQVVATGCCVAFDFDVSGFVDLRDAARMQNEWSVVDGIGAVRKVTPG